METSDKCGNFRQIVSGEREAAANLLLPNLLLQCT
jgi:hypothetical protein